MTDKQKILAEIERLRKNLPWGGSAVQMTMECNCKNEAYTEIEKFINSLPEEPVSEDLEEAAEKYAYENWQSDDYHDGAAEGLPFDAIGHTKKCFKAGAQWQFSQLEKNRLAACDRQTEEEREREQDFVDKIVFGEHRQPTYSDAIEYGIKLQQEKIEDVLLSEVLPYFMHGGEADEVIAKLDEVLMKK